jgi:ABC-type transporter Mla subunit MlaD
MWKYLTLTPLLAVAIGIVVHFTIVLQNDPYTRHYRVRFKAVQGLRDKGKSKVLARGVEVGKVVSIDLDAPEGPTVDIKVFPGLVISRRQSRLEVVSANAFGLKRIDLDPGLPPRSDDEVYGATDLIPGIDDEPSAMAAMLRRRDPAVGEFIADLERQTRDLRKAETTLGRVLYERAMASGAESSVRELSGSARGLARSARDMARGEGPLGDLLSDRGQVTELQEQLHGASEGLEDLARSLRDSNRGEGTLGRFLGSRDLAIEARDGARSLARSTRSLGEGEGALGRWLTEPEPTENLMAGIEDWRDAAADANDRDAPRLGALLYDPSGARALAETLARERLALHELRRGRGPLGRFLADPESRVDIDDVARRLSELTEDGEEAIHRFVAEQGVNRVVGAVFSIF